MRARTFFALLAFCVTSSASLAAGSADLTLSFRDQRKELTIAELARLPHVDIEALDHGEPHRYRGIVVRDLLALVGAPLGEHQLRGPAVALVVRVRAADGYVAAFALAEFDSAFRASDIILADAQDGGPLSATAGPFRLVCPGDKRGARWVRQVISMEILSVSDL